MFHSTICGILLFAFVAGIPTPKANLPRLDGKIVGGQNVDIAEYPYQVSLLYYDSHLCGGSLISTNVVVTAAHCTNEFSSSNMKIRAGSSVRNYGGAVVSVEKVIQNPQFNPVTFDYDISLLVLSESLETSPVVSLIGLPEADQTLKSNATAVCTGWGALSEGGFPAYFLQAVEVPIVDNDACNVDYGGAITSRMICAGLRGVGGKDACQGDSGGPLALDDELVGVVSWGYGCARPEYPGVYSSVPALRNFISGATGI